MARRYATKTDRRTLRSLSQPMNPRDDDDSHVEELIALTGDYQVTRAAFEEAVRRRPARIVTLRQQTRLLADSRKNR